MPTVDGRLAKLARRYALDDRATGALRSLLDTVAADETAPTTVRDPEQALDVHIADSLVALELDAVRSAGRIADLGAGAGFPGLALAAALPATRVFEVESVGRKGAFMQAAIEAAGLGNASVVVARAEEWTEGFARCDVVTARALAPLDVLAEYAAPLLCLGGVLVAWKGARDPAEEAAGHHAAGVLGLEAGEVRRVHPFPAAEHRYLHLYTKVSSTPPRFPRRAGMARKRPLGRSTSA